MITCPDVSVCAVTKNKTVAEVEGVLKKYPFITMIGENRWPDCVEKFEYFKGLEKHFIGPLQSNKVRKVVKISDVIQSVDSIELLEKINSAAGDENKKIDFCFQVNISRDPQKHGIEPDDISRVIEQYISGDFQNVRLIGLMTIGAQEDMQNRLKYFSDFKKLFDEINHKQFNKTPLKVLSMGMSEDYELAIKAGATMVRLGSVLFTK